LQPLNPAGRVHFCNWFLQSVVEGEIDSQLTFFPDEAWFHLQGYMNTQDNSYWNSQNPDLTQEGSLHPVKVCVWCAAVRGLLDLCFFKEKINCEKYVQVIIGQFSSDLTEEENLYGWCQQDSATARMYVYAGFLRCLRGQNYQQWYLASMFA
jgi:sulfur relay (sulfurtransferase) complex TusBCD TusD component (DsrE family)